MTAALDGLGLGAVLFVTHSADARLVETALECRSPCSYGLSWGWPEIQVALGGKFGIPEQLDTTSAATSRGNKVRPTIAAFVLSLVHDVEMSVKFCHGASPNQGSAGRGLAGRMLCDALMRIKGHHAAGEGERESWNPGWVRTSVFGTLPELAEFWGKGSWGYIIPRNKDRTHKNWARVNFLAILGDQWLMIVVGDGS